MSAFEYVRSKAAVLIVGMVGIASACAIAVVCGCPFDAVALMAGILLMCAIAACAFDYLRMRRFYREIRELTNALEHPYQMHSLITLPTSPDQAIVFDALFDLGKALVEKGIDFEVAGVSLHGCGSMQRVPLDTSAISDAALIVIVPDEVVEALDGAGSPAYSYLNVMYWDDRERGDAALSEVLREAVPLADGATPASHDMEDQYQKGPWPVSNVYTGRSMADQAGGLRMVISFLALYIGFVMLVATAAVLAIQQLSETADSLGRYRRLSDLGSDMRQILGSVRAQTIAYFCAPLALAACHTVCAVMVIGATLFAELGVNPTGLIGVSACSIGGVYAIYLIATYLLSKSIVRTSVMQRKTM